LFDILTPIPLNTSAGKYLGRFIKPRANTAADTILSEIIEEGGICVNQEYIVEYIIKKMEEYRHNPPGNRAVGKINPAGSPCFPAEKHGKITE